MRESNRIAPPLKRVMMTKSIRVREALITRVEEALWNPKLGGIPHGRQVEFFDAAITHELDRIEGKGISQAIDYLSDLYAELGKAPRVSEAQLNAINEAINILRKLEGNEENATI
jgi:hypothetical protein